MNELGVATEFSWFSFGEEKNTSLELLRAVLMKSMCFAWCFLSFQFACLKESYSVFVFCLS